jgi:hypothetical protein
MKRAKLNAASEEVYFSARAHARQTAPAVLGFIAQLLAAKICLVQAVEADTAPDASILRELEARLRAAGPALLAELQAARATGDAAARLETIAADVAQIGGDAPIAESGVHEFASSRDSGKIYRVTWGRAGHLECTCEGFRWRGECKHVRQVRKTQTA